MNSPRGDAAQGGKLVALEAGRFFAALGVVLFHYTGIVEHFRGVIVFDDVFRPGHVGVPYFFVLSGFIISHVHRADVGRPGRIGDFVSRRLTRLFPMFWLISLAMLAAFTVAPALGDGRTLSAGSIVSDLLLLPHGSSILPISWTLRHEMVFYALFAVVIAVGRRGYWLIVAWIALSLALGAWIRVSEADLGSWSVIAGPVNLGFAIGLIVQALTARRSGVSGKPWALLGFATMLGLCVLEWWLGHGTPHSLSVLGPIGEIGYMLGAGSLIFGLVKIEHAGWRMPLPGLWQVLGGASYVLYLVHQPLGSVAMRLLAKFPAMPASMVFIVSTVLAVTAAVLLHLLVERPLLRVINRVVRRRATAMPSAAAAPGVPS